MVGNQQVNPVRKENKIILYIFGAGGGATELLEDTDFFIDGKHYPLFNEIILLEDKPKINDRIICGKKYFVMPVSSIVGNPKISYGHISAYNSKFKETIDKKFKNLIWTNSVSPGANISLEVLSGGIGLNIRSGAFVGSTVKLGRHVKINYGAKITHNCEVGDYSFVSINASICSGTKIGSCCFIGAGTVIVDKNITIGNNTIIGAGSVVTKDIPSNVVAYGNPCKVVRDND